MKLDGTYILDGITVMPKNPTNAMFPIVHVENGAILISLADSGSVVCLTPDEARWLIKCGIPRALKAMAEKEREAKP